MKKSILETKGYFEGKEFKVTHINITEAVACHEKNKALKLNVGFAERTQACTEEQPSDTPLGYYLCVGNQWTYIPYS